MKSILSRSFRYTSAVETDLRKTFARVRKELKQAEQKAVEQPAQLTAQAKIRRVR